MRLLFTIVVVEVVHHHLLRVVEVMGLSVHTDIVLLGGIVAVRQIIIL